MTLGDGVFVAGVDVTDAVLVEDLVFVHDGECVREAVDVPVGVAACAKTASDAIAMIVRALCPEPVGAVGDRWAFDLLRTQMQRRFMRQRAAAGRCCR